MNKAEKGMSMNTTVKKPKKELKPKDLSLGDTVQVLSMNLKGTVSSHSRFQRLPFCTDGYHPFQGSYF